MAQGVGRNLRFTSFHSELSAPFYITNFHNHNDIEAINDRKKSEKFGKLIVLQVLQVLQSCSSLIFVKICRTCMTCMTCTTCMTFSPLPPAPRPPLRALCPVLCALCSVPLPAQRFQWLYEPVYQPALFCYYICRPGHFTDEIQVNVVSRCHTIDQINLGDIYIICRDQRE